MNKNFTKFDKAYKQYSTLISEGWSSKSDAVWWAEHNAEMRENRAAMSKRVLTKYKTVTLTRKCPICGKLTQFKVPEIPLDNDQRHEWDRQEWWNGLSKEDKVIYRTGKCHDCQRGLAPAPIKHDEDPEV